MTVWTWLWIGWGVTFCVIEGVALFNSTRGDTLSEHVWAWLGVRTRKWQAAGEWDGGPDRRMPVTPKWTLRVARIVVLSFMLWLTLHFATGGWV